MEVQKRNRYSNEYKEDVVLKASHYHDTVDCYTDNEMVLRKTKTKVVGI